MTHALPQIKIGEKLLGPGAPCYIIAEAGVNHNGSLDMALKLVESAKNAGADCVKFQTFKAERVVTTTAPKANYQLNVTDQEESQLDMLRKLELPLDAYQEIIAHCQKFEIDFLSTPYNEEDIEFLDDLGVKAFKVASGQLVETHFLRQLARKKKPVILSTGMATLAEVFEAVETLRKESLNDIIVLQCTTNYPSAIEDAHISAMNSMGQALHVLTGYSDHVPNDYASLAAVARGAVLIEKHFTMDRRLPGPDHSSSLDPRGLQNLVNGVRSVEASLGQPVKKPTPAEISNTVGMRRSLVLKEALEAGEIIEERNLTAKRPATGILPAQLDRIVGKKVSKRVEADKPLQWNEIDQGA